MNPTYCSVLNIYGKSFLPGMFYSLGSIAKLFTDSGYDGMEWHPLSVFTLPGLQIKTGLRRQDDYKYIRSLHQSFRTEPNILAVHSPLSALATVILDYSPTSLFALHGFDDSLPVVVYPEQVEDRGVLGKRQAIFQPTASQAKEWDIKHASSWTVAMESRGLDGFCVDTHHIRGIDGQYKIHWWEFIARHINLIKSVHVAIGRIDVPNPNFDTMEELTDLIEDKEHTDVSNILYMLKDYNYQGPLVVEVWVDALALYTGKRLLNRSDVVDLHSRIIHSLRRRFQ